MAKQYAKLQRIDDDEATAQTGDFLSHLKKGLLLALVEQGFLDAAQYRRAEQDLK